MKFTTLYIIVFSCLFCACTSDSDETEPSESNDQQEFLTDSISNEVEPNPMFSKESILKDPVIDEFDFDGSVISSFSWTDANGTNFLINTIAKRQVDGLPAMNLYSYHYIKDSEGKIELLRLVQDYEDFCDFDITLEFLGEPTITDLNEDNFAEVSVTYRKTCRSDVSECEMKLIMHDQNGKYGLRGFQYIVFPDSPEPIGYQFDLSKAEKTEDVPEWLDFRGRYKNANDFKNCDPSFFKLADSVWQANAFERFD